MIGCGLKMELELELDLELELQLEELALELLLELEGRVSGKRFFMLRTERLRPRTGGRDVLKVVGEMFLAGRASVACGAGKGAGTSNANMGCMPHGLMLMPLGESLREKGRTSKSQGWSLLTRMLAAWELLSL